MKLSTTFGISVMLAGAGLPGVSGHYVFSKLIVNGEKTNDFEYIRRNSNGYQPTPASDILNDDFRCNQGSMSSAAGTKVYKAEPGAEIGFELAYGMFN